jgi:hypothetical protein
MTLAYVSVFFGVLCSGSRTFVAREKPESELKRLRAEQEKTRRDEVFGGLSPLERAEYDKKAERIRGLERDTRANGIAKKGSQVAKVTQVRASKVSTKKR